MKRLFLLLLVVPSLAGVAQAQQPAASPDVAVRTVRGLWQDVTNYVTRAAEDVPDSLYAFRPVATVRTFGQLIGHVAGAQYLICAAALGDAPRAEDEIEKTRTTKTELVAALRASTEYCGRAYAQTDAAAQQRTQLFGQDRSRLTALGINATHNAEHYGNLVTYMRMNGLVPPSSRPPQ
ncbi:MAG TPA: DinB family protein [Gemmatimonadales bacterium]|nr:DinB family protein [Gemmatimonadales bacterium]